MDSSNLQSRLTDLRPKLLSFAYSLTKDKKGAQQLLDDTTVQVLALEGSYTSNTNLQGWVLSHMRSIFRRHGVADIVAVEENVADCYQLKVEAQMDVPQSTMSAGDMAAVVDGLEEVYSRPFNMYAGGYDCAEIARELNISHKTVTDRILFVQRRLECFIR